MQITLAQLQAIRKIVQNPDIGKYNRYTHHFVCVIHMYNSL
jgi:hypothetical protein